MNLEELNKKFTETKSVSLGLCEGRHTINEVDGYIFSGELNLLDVQGLQQLAHDFLAQIVEDTYQIELSPGLPTQVEYTDSVIRKPNGTINLYVTGLTVALVAVLNAAYNQGIDLKLFHFDRESQTYYPQSVAF